MPINKNAKTFTTTKREFAILPKKKSK